MYFVSGITGQVGGAVARKLLADGHDVRALVRNPGKCTDWSKMGVELRVGDANNADDVASALDSVDGAFLMMFPTHPTQGYPEARSTVNSYRDALSKAPPPRLVILSSFGSEQPHGLGNITSTHLLEQALSDVAFPTAFVRAGSFIENYSYGLMQAESSGSFGIFLSPTDRGVPMVASVDIGNEVASLLTTDWDGKRIIELGSRITPDDLALAMSEVLGKHVTAYAIPRDQWNKSLVYMGVPAESISMYEEMMESINSGWIDFEKPGTERVTGVTSAAQVFVEACQQKKQSA
jgi:uncharacterized protein YbjT (DUF2867 family)